MSVFLQIDDNDKVFQNEHFFMIYDRYPVSPGHLLIITNQLRKDFFDLNKEERLGLVEMISKAKTIIEESNEPNGYNIGMNCGEAAGQTVFHFHCHVIPRYSGDMNDPRGGVRHSVEGKGNYFEGR